MFSGIATLDGDHVTTFDGEEFDFTGGKCSYVLTKDYLEGNFTIIASYLGKGKKKMVIQTATQTIQVAPNGKVCVFLQVKMVSLYSNYQFTKCSALIFLY